MRLTPIHYNEFLNEIFESALNGSDFSNYYISINVDGGPQPFFPIAGINFMTGNLMVYDESEEEDYCSCRSASNPDRFEFFKVVNEDDEI